VSQVNPTTAVADLVGAAIVDDLDGLYRFALLLTGDDPAAQDVVQETAARALAAADGFRGDASARTCLHRIAYHVVTDVARRSSRVAPTAEVEALWRDDDRTVDTVEWGRRFCGPSPTAVRAARRTVVRRPGCGSRLDTARVSAATSDLRRDVRRAEAMRCPGTGRGGYRSSRSRTRKAPARTASPPAYR
jgi:DNA-directed RNA polymerase specialized sigma24 family protein